MSPMASRGRTPRIGFLAPVGSFLELMPHAQRLDAPVFATGSLKGEAPVVVVPAAP